MPPQTGRLRRWPGEARSPALHFLAGQHAASPGPRAKEATAVLQQTSHARPGRSFLRGADRVQALPHCAAAPPCHRASGVVLVPLLSASPVLFSAAASAAATSSALASLSGSLHTTTTGLPAALAPPRSSLASAAPFFSTTSRPAAGAAAPPAAGATPPAAAPLPLPAACALLAGRAAAAGVGAGNMCAARWASRSARAVGPVNLCSGCSEGGVWRVRQGNFSSPRSTGLAPWRRELGRSITFSSASACQGGRRCWCRGEPERRVCRG